MQHFECHDGFIACFFADLSHASTWATTDLCILARLSWAQCDWKHWCAIESAFCSIDFNMKTTRIQTPATSQHSENENSCILRWFLEVNYQPVAKGRVLQLLELVEPDQAVAKFALSLGERWRRGRQSWRLKDQQKRSFSFHIRCQGNNLLLSLVWRWYSQSTHWPHPALQHTGRDGWTKQNGLASCESTDIAFGDRYRFELKR